MLTLRFNYVFAALFFLTFVNSLKAQFGAISYEAPLTEAQFDAIGIDQNLAVGVTPGAASVSASGAATYTIPIQVPPGTRGIQPNLSISYSSQAGSGIAGYGWGLAGLSSITRGDFQYYVEGFKGRPDNDLMDVYYLDGQRLINGATSYGTGTQFQLRDNSAPLKAQIAGVTSTGPSAFAVFMDGGLTSEYGDNDGVANSNWYHNDGTKLTWAINKSFDCDGNFMEYIYFDEQNDGVTQQLIKEIRYTGNAQAGLQPYNKVVFNYGIKQDKKPYYVNGGSPTSIDQYLISRIDVYGEGNILFKSYRFIYAFVENKSMLKSIQECDGDGNCLNPTYFLTGASGTTISSIPANQLFINDPNYTYVPGGDINGDGFEDLFVFGRFITPISSQHNVAALLNDPSNPGNFSVEYTTSMMTGYGLITDLMYSQGDYNGDGLADIAVAIAASNPLSGPSSTALSGVAVIYTDPNDPSGYSSSIFSIPNALHPESFINNSIPNGYTGDFDGDGRSDFLVFYQESGGSFKMRIYLAGGGLGVVDVNAHVSTVSTENIRVIDFDGDGDSEILQIIDGVGTTAITYDFNFDLSTTPISGNSDIILLNGFPTKYHDIHVGDFNGDGISDLLTSINNNADWFLDLGNGAGYDMLASPSVPTSILPLIEPSYKVGDFDGDGLSDLSIRANNSNIASSATSPAIVILRSTGSGLEAGGNWISSSPRLLSSSEDPFYRFNMVLDINGDGRSDLLADIHSMNPVNSGSSISIYYDGQERNLLKVKNGLGKEHEFEYKGLSQLSTYAVGTQLGYPFVKINAPLKVVKSHVLEGVLGSGITTFYKYQGALVNLTGLGFLGFDKIITTNSENDINTEVNYGFNIPTMSRFLESKKSTDPTLGLTAGSPFNNADISEEIYTYTHHLLDNQLKIYWQERETIETKQFLTNSKTRVTIDENQDRTVSSIITEIGLKITGGATDPALKVITQNFEGMQSGCNDMLVGVYGYTNTTVTRGASTHLLSTTNTIDASNNRIVQVSSTPNYVDYVTTTNSQYDVFGNIISSQISGTGVSPRTSGLVFDTKGRWPINSINALGQSNAQNDDIHPFWGKPNIRFGITGNFELFEYDGFGKLIEKTNALGVSSSISYEWQNVSGSGTSTNTAGGSVFKTIASTQEAPEVHTYYNSNSMKRMVHILDANNTKTVTTYDSQGRVVTSTAPFTVGNEIYTTKVYDDFNRVLNSTTTGVGQTQYSYGYGPLQNIVQVTLPSGESKTTTSDVSGVVNTVLDDGGTLTYEYDSHDNLMSTSLNGTLVNSSLYDDFGRQLELWDNSAGTTNYDYNVYGELIEQKTGNGAFIETFQYDNLGRLTHNNLSEGTIYYSYIPFGNNGANKIGIITNYDGEVEKFEYDNFNRLLKKTYVNENVAEIYQYDNLGRLSDRIIENKMAFRYTYEPTFGKLTAIHAKAEGEQAYTNLISGMNEHYLGGLTSYMLTAGQIVTQSFDPYGRLESTVSSSNFNYSYSWDPITGNLDSRSDNLNGLTESFNYDNMQRLETVSMNSNVVHTNAYDNLGNFDNKSDVGDHSNGGFFRQTAIENIIPAGASTPNISLLPQRLSHTSFNEPLEIREGLYVMQFEYNSNKTRKRSVLGIPNSSGQLTPVWSKKYFSDFGYEVYTNHSTQIRSHIFYEYAKGKVIAMIVKEEDLANPANNNPFSTPNGVGYHSTFTDHLGSILKLQDHGGSNAGFQSFDAHGRHRNPLDWTYTTSTILAPNPEWLYRGFTGHEHLPEFALIHMNGRLYAPLTGKMLSPDNFVQSLFSTQSYNRYAYTFNNPLKYTDPSGEFIVADSWAIGFVDGFFSTSSGRWNAGWNEANHRAEMDARIWGGLFASDPNGQGGGGRTKEVFSRFTWQLPQTVGGFATAHVINTLGFYGGVSSVEYAYGTTVVATNSENWGGVTQSNYIVGNNTIEANANNTLFQHEYGHYLQSREMGFAYYNVVGIPSIRSASARDVDHGYSVFEQDANRRAFLYFNANVDGFKDDIDFGSTDWGVENKGWNFVANPLTLEGGRGFEDNMYIDVQDPNSLSQIQQVSVLRAGFLDYASWSTMFLVMPFNVAGPIISGLLKPIR